MYVILSSVYNSEFSYFSHNFINFDLIDQKNTTIYGKIHNAGFIKKIIKKDLIKTTNGMYHLVTPPAEPKTKINEKLYTFWMITGGFPKKFKEL